MKEHDGYLMSAYCYGGERVCVWVFVSVVCVCVCVCLCVGVGAGSCMRRACT